MGNGQGRLFKVDEIKPKGWVGTSQIKLGFSVSDKSNKRLALKNKQIKRL
jgi:hypothetical protein